MSQVANNADDYANGRLNIFFKGVTPDLDGQCVSLVKWFLQDMTGVPNPQAARGDARYVGQTLVAQGLAVEVPYAERRRGDVICLEYGTYGHIYVQLSGNRVFEENVNWPGIASEIVAGSPVYASRIGSDSEAWRHDFHAYRIKSYNETGETTMPEAQDVKNYFLTYLGYAPKPDQITYYVARNWQTLASDVCTELLNEKIQVEKQLAASGKTGTVLKPGNYTVN